MDPPAVECRELRRADLKSFQGVVQQGLGPLERATGLDEMAISQFQSLQRPLVWAGLAVLRALGRAPIKIFVGVEGGRVLGTASVILLPKSAYVLGVATDSAARNRGIATRLMEMTHLEARKRGRPWVTLDVESENETALRVYRRLGYEEASRFGWYVGPVPEALPERQGTAVTVPSSRMKEAAAWVEAMVPPQVREPLPPTEKRLSHIEAIVQSPRTPSSTWELLRSGKVAGLVRGFYSPMVKTGYAVIAAFDPALAGDSLRPLVTVAAGWVRSLGGVRMVVVAPPASAEVEAMLVGAGLAKAVSTTLMRRPADAPVS